jgi:dihydroflavonol-4-reductase
MPTTLKAYIGPNVEGTRTVIENSIRMGVKRLVFVSTANTVGHGTIDNPGRDDWPVAKPPFSKLGYARSKMMAEDLVKNAVKNLGLNAIIVNPTFIIGPYDAKPSTNRIFNIYYKGRFAVLPPGGKSFIYSGDVASAICNGLQLGRPGERYLLSGSNLTLGQFFDLVEEITGIRQRRLMLPPWIVRLAGYFGSLMNHFGAGSQLNRVTSRILCLRNYYTNEKALQELKMPQTPVETAIREAWEYIRRQTADSGPTTDDR